MENKQKKVVERYFFLEEEHAEYGDTQDSVGYEKYIDDVIVAQHGIITDWFVDKNGVLNEAGATVLTDEGGPKYVKETPEQKVKRKRRITLGDRISKFESEENNLNGESL